jgi:hypothetical protein
MLIVKPIEPIKPFHRQPRTFRAIEYLVPAERIRLLARLFKSMDFPGRQLKITDTTDQTCVGGPM